MDKQEDIITTLLEEFKKTRESIKTMIADLEKVSEKVDTIFPDSLNSKLRWVFEQKVKTTTEMFKALLEMRKEVMKSLKDEIEVRRRIDKDLKGEGEDLLEGLIDIRKLAKKVEEFKGKKERLEKTISETSQKVSLAGGS